MNPDLYDELEADDSDGEENLDAEEGEEGTLSIKLQDGVAEVIEYKTGS